MLLGPAADLYRALIPVIPMRDRWIAEIRELWGNKEHPSLYDFSEVAVEEQSFSSWESGINVPVTIFIPPIAFGDAFLYLHGGDPIRYAGANVVHHGVTGDSAAPTRNQ